MNRKRKRRRRRVWSWEEASMTVLMETEFVSGLPIWKKMSNGRKQANGSLVGGNEMQRFGSTTEDPARGSTRSGMVNFAPTDDLGSMQPVEMTTRTTGERRTNTGTDRMVYWSTPQISGTPSSSEANPRMAKRASSVTRLEYTNSSRKRMQPLQCAETSTDSTAKRVRGC